jgi:transposase
MRNEIYPTLLQASNNINSHSWFDIKVRKNLKKNKNKNNYEYNYINTLKIKLLLNEKQKKIIKLWLDDVIDIYNFSNEYIKEHLENDYKNFRKLVNFISLREEINYKIKEICSKNNLPKHTGDYAVKHIVEMYKSAFSNLKAKNIKVFDIKNLLKSRTRKNLVIEPSSVSKKSNSFFPKTLGNVDSSLKLNLIKKNSILQYNKHKNTFIIISPIDINKKVILKQYKKCGIDIGIRTFLTVYSPEITYEIGTNTNSTIDKINNRLDKIKSSKDNNIINEKKYNKIFIKYSNKKQSLINDLHNKSSQFLLKQFEIINIGKVSTKKMVSNLEGNLHDLVKRRLMTLSHYRFRMKLHQMKVKYNNKINEIDEYMTSKKCCNCQNINKKLKAEKIYKCSKCKLIIDRDINASINIYDL